MPGYEIKDTGQGQGLLPWSWAVEHLVASHDYWVASVRPDGRPHVMPVWGAWIEDALWFSSSIGSRKTLNLRADPRCSASTDNAFEPVILEGQATVVTDAEPIRRVLDALNAKYDAKLAPDFLNPTENATFRVDPDRAFGSLESDFTGTATRWRFRPAST
jgi:PPOX class probable F420-dependent enzyme